MVILGSKVTWVSRVTRERLVWWASEEKMDLRGRRENRVPVERLDPWARLEKRENLGFQDCLATQEDKVLKALMASLD